MIILLSLLVCIIGGLIHLLSKDDKRAALGRIAFGAGLLVFLLQAEKVLSLLLR